jgi:hypothetical protein
MNIRSIISKNRKYLIIAWIVIIIILAIVAFALSRNKEEEVEVGYNYKTAEDTSIINYDYPDIWTEDSTDYSKEGYDHEVSTLKSDDNSFEVKVSYQYVSDEELANYQSPTFGGTDVLIYPSDYNSSEFERITSINGSELLVSMTGAHKYSENSIMGNVTPEIGESYDVYQVYENEDGSNGISDMITAFDNEETPVIYRSLMITYKFNTEEAILKWSGFKEVLKTVIESIEKK